MNVFAASNIHNYLELDKPASCLNHLTKDKSIIQINGNYRRRTRKIS